MQFPQVIAYHGAEVVIYGKTAKTPHYRLSWYANGKRVQTSAATYAEAHSLAKEKAKELHSGNQSSALTKREVTAALALREGLQSIYRESGRTMSALEFVTEGLAALKALGDHRLMDAVNGYLGSVVVLRTQTLAKAVEEFNAVREPKGESKDGKRSSLNPKYVKNTARWLQDFSKTFPGINVGDLTKDHLELYISAHSKVTSKSRNDRRNTIKMFLAWCVRKDYLRADHRLCDADGFITEPYVPGAIDFYRPAELLKMLESSEGQMRVVIALQGLAGLRLEEVSRMGWHHVFGASGCIEITDEIAKMRDRRLVTICPALEQWLAPFRKSKGKIMTEWKTLSGFGQAYAALRKKLKIPSRRNGLRHAFATYHYALHCNEHLTASQTGHDPKTLHKYYRGLATKADAESYFKVTPATPSNVVLLEEAAG